MQGPRRARGDFPAARPGEPDDRPRDDRVTGRLGAHGSHGDGADRGSGRHPQGQDGGTAAADPAQARALGRQVGVGLPAPGGRAQRGVGVGGRRETAAIPAVIPVGVGGGRDPPPRRPNVVVGQVGPSRQPEHPERIRAHRVSRWAAPGCCRSAGGRGRGTFRWCGAGCWPNTSSRNTPTSARAREGVSAGAAPAGDAVAAAAGTACAGPVPGAGTPAAVGGSGLPGTPVLTRDSAAGAATSRFT